jgi:hypothetical protein
MKCIVGASAMALAMALTAGAVTPALSQERPASGGAPSGSLKPSDLAPNPQIEIGYVQPKNPDLRPIHDKLKKRRVLEDLRAFLSPLRLPRKIQVKLDQCGATTARYKPGGPVTICYEYVSAFEETAPEATIEIGGLPFTQEDALVGAFVHGVLHEVARAVFDVLEIPVWGGETHAADRVAGYIMFQFGEKAAYRTLVGTSWFMAQSGQMTSGMPSGDFSAIAREDSGMLQRFYNTLCIALGGDSEKFAFLTKTLPEERAKSCRADYLQLQQSFADTFMSHVDRELLKKVQATDWLGLTEK